MMGGARGGGVPCGGDACDDPSVSFEPVSEGVSYDALLVISGCANRCASIDEYETKTPPVHVWNEGEAVKAAEHFASCNNAKRKKDK
jgi:hypothetical protein